MQPIKIEAIVPCDGCVRCCIKDAVRILPHEDSTQYETEKHPYIKDSLMLAHKENGECVYLGEFKNGYSVRGCTIHLARPEQCRTMDCRNIAKNMSYTQVRKMHFQIAVWRKGKELIDELP